MKTVLIVAALVCAIILTLLGFEVFTTSNPHLFGWLGAALAFGYGSKLVP